MGGTRGNARWWVIFWAFIVAALSYLDRSNISVAATPIQASFNLSNVQLGTVFSAFAVGYAFTQPIAGRIADRFGPRKVIFVGALWWSALTAACALVPPGYSWSLALLMVARFTLGVGEAVIFPASNRLVASWIPSQERGLANGLIFAGVGFGAGVAPPLITYLILVADWRLAFFVTAIIGVVVAVAWYVAIRDAPAYSAHVRPEEAAYINAGLKGALGEKPMKWSTILRDRQVLLLTLSYFGFGYVAFIFFTWLFKYLSSVRGLDLKASALYAILPFIAMSLGSWLGGVLGDRLTRRFGKRIGRCGVAGGSLLLASVFVALATQVADARLAAVVLAGGAGALYMSISSFWSLSADFGGASAGSVSGVMNMANQIGSVVTASLTAILADRFGWTSSFLVAAAICFAGAVLWLFIDPDHKMSAGETDPVEPRPT